jgi:hypothetical protein
MDGTIITELIEFLKTASPVVWQSLIKQVYSEAVSQLAWALALGGSCFGLVKLFIHGNKQYKEDNYSEWEKWRWVSLVGSVLAGFISFGLIVGAVQWFINPEFYAIRFLLEKLTGN